LKVTSTIGIVVAAKKRRVTFEVWRFLVFDLNEGSVRALSSRVEMGVKFEMRNQPPFSSLQAKQRTL